VDSNAHARWDSSDWDLDIVFEVDKEDSDNKFHMEVDLVVDSEAASVAVINQNQLHKQDGPSLKPDVSVACLAEIQREANDLLMSQAVDSLKSMIIRDVLQLTLHSQLKLNSILLKKSHTVLSFHSDHL